MFQGILRYLRIIGIIAGVLALGLVLIVGFIWGRLEQRYVFFPSDNVQSTPADAGLKYEDVFFNTDGGRQLHGWYVPGEDEARNATWIWFHGNGGNIGHRVDELAIFRYHIGVNMFIFDYQGYGRSQGEPTEQGTYRDARAALEYVVARPAVDPQKIVYFGRSLGAAVAVELATEEPPAGMVLISPFSSLEEMGRLAFPHLPVGWILKGRYDSMSRISRIHTPLLIIHGDQDQTVPVEQGRALYLAANEPKSFRLLPIAGHNDTYLNGGSAYWDALEGFVKAGKKRSP